MSSSSVSQPDRPPCNVFASFQCFYNQIACISLAFAVHLSLIAPEPDPFSYLLMFQRTVFGSTTLAAGPGPSRRAGGSSGIVQEDRAVS